MMRTSVFITKSDYTAELAKTSGTQVLPKGQGHSPLPMRPVDMSYFQKKEHFS